MKKAVFGILGTISLTLGIVGIMLPVLPTTPFLLVSLYCYMRSSKKLYHFVLNNKYLAPYVKDYISRNGIPIGAKKKAIFFIWLTIGISIVFAVNEFYLRAVLFLIASIVTTYLWTRPTFEKQECED